MAEKPIRVFYSKLTGTFYASNRYRVEERDGKEFVTITGKKYDVTQDVARAVVEHEIEFIPEEGDRDGS